MGVMWHGAEYLCLARREGLKFDRTVTVGRSYFQVHQTKFCHMLKYHGLDGSPGAPAYTDEPPRYAESFFKLLGAETVDAIDASSYEGANVVCDLNHPIPSELHGRYDVVYDGGSLEHIFNVPQALKNYMSLAREGGSVIVDTMANNCMGHGLYQFSPELFHRAFSPENGFSVVNVVVFEYYDYSPMYRVPDPASVRSRIELVNPRRVGVIAHARRDRVVPIFENWPQQSDYTEVWDGRAEMAAPAPASPASPGLKREMIERVKRLLPGMVYLKHDLIRRFPKLPGWKSRSDGARANAAFSFESQPGKFVPWAHGPKNGR